MCSAEGPPRLRVQGGRGDPASLAALLLPGSPVMMWGWAYDQTRPVKRWWLSGFLGKRNFLDALEKSGVWKGRWCF